MNKFHPILYSTQMVQAIFEGRKIMTRRKVKLSFHPDTVYVTRIHPFEDIYLPYDKFDRTTGNGIKCPYGNVGDVLWVRETFSNIGLTKNIYTYKADFPNATWKWKPSIFMPKAACRLFLEITEVRIERLHEISEEDAISEGILIDEEGMECYDYENKIYRLWPQGSFESLWQKINGAESWNANPFVWVISFKQIDKPINFI